MTRYLSVILGALIFQLTIVVFFNDTWIAPAQFISTIVIFTSVILFNTSRKANKWFNKPLFKKSKK